MDAIVACCAGLDVPQASVVACLNRGGKRGAGKEIRSFGTTRSELAEMVAWLRDEGCTLVAMESTGKASGRGPSVPIKNVCVPTGPGGAPSRKARALTTVALRNSPTGGFHPSVC